MPNDLHEIQDWFLKRVCQIFVTNKNGFTGPEASGFLVEVSNLKLLITAGHVIMDGLHKVVYLPNYNSGGLIHMYGTWYPSDNLSNIGLDINDFAYLILGENLINELLSSGYKFTSISNIDFNHLPSSNKMYTATGCRANKSKKVRRDTYSRMEIITNYGCKDYLYCDRYTKKSFVNVKNDRKLVGYENNQLGKTGNLKGMSGGPVWHTDLNHKYDKLTLQSKL